MPDWPRLAVAVVAAVALVLSAPFLGLARSELRRAFPETYLWILAALVAAGALAALAAAFSQIRDRKGPRWTMIAAAAGAAALYAFANSTGRRDSDLVELFHFLQYGVVTFLFYRAFRAAGDASMIAVPMLAGVVVGAAEEWFQWFLPGRVGELRDLSLNLAAITCGIVCSLAIAPPDGLSRRLRPGASVRIGAAAAAAVAAIAVFVDVVHLGSRVADDEIGLFVSRFSRARLLTLQDQRAAAWATDPPPVVVRRLSREDQYLSEATEHARQRNERWEAGDVFAAWHENRILEKYFAPTLDLTSYVAPNGFRWPAAQRRDAEQRAAAARDANPARLFVSEAYPYPIFFWPRWLFRLVAASSALFVLAMGKVFDVRSVDARPPARRGLSAGAP